MGVVSKHDALYLESGSGCLQRIRTRFDFLFSEHVVEKSYVSTRPHTPPDVAFGKTEQCFARLSIPEFAHTPMDIPLPVPPLPVPLAFVRGRLQCLSLRGLWGWDVSGLIRRKCLPIRRIIWNALRDRSTKPLASNRTADFKRPTGIDGHARFSIFVLQYRQGAIAEHVGRFSRPILFVHCLMHVRFHTSLRAVGAFCCGKTTPGSYQARTVYRRLRERRGISKSRRV